MIVPGGGVLPRPADCRTGFPIERGRISRGIALAGACARSSSRSDRRNRRRRIPTPWIGRRRGGRLPWQHQLVNRVRGSSLRRRVEDMHRNGAVPDNPDVLHGPWRAVGVRCGTRDRAGRENELQMPRVAEGRLDRDTVDANQRRHHKSASFQHHSTGWRSLLHAAWLDRTDHGCEG
jgi:hypothetical protein